MKSLAAVAALLLVSGAATARAQETPAPTPAPALVVELDNEPAPARRHLQVLHDPYEISSFYRSSQGSGPSDFGSEATGTSDRYPIAGFYRAGARGRYSMFWTSGYGSGRNGYGMGRRGRGLIGTRRPRALGLNGDLCLFAPTFLAPVGPLTGVFLER
jgi:hypothetical protein